MKRILVPVIGLLVAGGFTSTACSGGSANVEFKGRENKDAGTEAGGGTGAGGGGGKEDDTTCDGECVPGATQGWHHAWFWIGPVNEERPCPSFAPNFTFKGYKGLIAPHDCDACSCESSTGTCKLPSVITARSEICGSGGQEFSFDAPDPWDGMCTDMNAIPAEPDCSNIPCIQSLTIEAITLVNEKCAPSETPVPRGLPTPMWETVAIGCSREGALTGCNNGAGVCLPTPDLGWQHCVWPGDTAEKIERECPPSYNEVRHLFYEAIDDQRKCSMCDCSPPQGSFCSALFSLYHDAACSVPLPLIRPIGSAFADCINLFPPGMVLGSKAITDVDYIPGSCEPLGGEPEGQATPIRPVTVCCLEPSSR
jgi:hypothetical protein